MVTTTAKISGFCDPLTFINYCIADACETVTGERDWRYVFRLICIRYVIRKNLPKLMSNMKTLEDNIKEDKDFLQLREGTPLLADSIDKLNEIITSCKSSRVSKSILKAEMPQLKNICERLECFLEKAEDNIDAFDVRQAKEEAKREGTISLADIKKELLL